MRTLRYETLHTYMPEAFEFDKFKDKRVLEIGCGGGIDSVEFAKNGAQVIATDLTKEAVAKTAKLAESLGLDVETRVVDARSLPFKDEAFDHVHVFGVLHHIPDVEKAVSEIHRVLKRGGTVYAMLYHRHSALYYVSIIFLRGIMQEHLKHMTEDELLCRFSEGRGGCPYTKVYTLCEALKLFEDFNSVSVSTHYNVFDLPMKRKIKFKGPNHLGWHLVVKARKQR